MQAVVLKNYMNGGKWEARWSIGSFANELLPLTSRNEPSLDSRRRKYSGTGSSGIISAFSFDPVCRTT